MPKQQNWATQVEGTVLALTWRATDEEYTWDTAKYPEAVQTYLQVHGFRALSSERFSELKADQELFVSSVDELHEQLKAGKLKKDRKVIRKPPEALVRLVQAIASDAGHDYPAAAIVAKLQTLPAEKWTEFHTEHQERYSEIKAELAAEKASASDIDLDSLL